MGLRDQPLRLCGNAGPVEPVCRFEAPRRTAGINQLVGYRSGSRTLCGGVCCRQNTYCGQHMGCRSHFHSRSGRCSVGSRCFWRLEQGRAGNCLSAGRWPGTEFTRNQGGDASSPQHKSRTSVERCGQYPGRHPGRASDRDFTLFAGPALLHRWRRIIDLRVGPASNTQILPAGVAKHTKIVRTGNVVNATRAIRRFRKLHRFHLVPSSEFQVSSSQWQKTKTPTAPLMIVNPQLETRNSKLETMGW